MVLPKWLKDVVSTQIIDNGLFWKAKFVYKSIGIVVRSKSIGVRQERNVL